ncbi:MAG TPA: hypothetical protein VGX27_06420 [Candidatus Dormibacteraeota bacterium]|nr:hypothetical protein [Candidatus Dormibacteraeota bacterium]
MTSRAVIGLFTLWLVAACQLPGTTPACSAQIDWVNFIEVGSSQYVAGLGAPLDVLQQSDLGPVYARVKFKVSGHVCDPNYRVKDGDAAFLEPGTPIYQVAGHAPSEELAASFNGSIVVYRVLPSA